ncbi:sensor histidine kinase [Afifella pfennigii]|uniref:sensor histidine kinase n=1 Tax=Afifella pfennigii TaxID=209897 RepID=UPI0009FC1F8E|nr:sensor histidine kinase [Afifella pfennigii]
MSGLAVAFAALAYGRQAAQQAYDRLLIGAAGQIAGAVSIRDGEVVVDIPASAFDLLALAREDRVVYAVFGPDGTLLTGYDELQRPEAAEDVAFAHASFAGEPVRLVALKRHFAERAFRGTVTVVVGQTLRARSELAWDIAGSALVVVAVAGLLMVALVIFAIRSALLPLRRIENLLSSREPQDLTPLRLAVPSEIGHLTAAINRFMARIDRQVTATRGLIADASHQLRTPVTALRAQAELAAEENDPERQRAIVARIHKRAVGLGRLTDQILSHAMIIHRAEAVPRESVDLRLVAMKAVEETDAGVEGAGAPIRLDLPEEPVLCRGDEFSLVEAVKNLLNNALKHGRPPVDLSAANEGERALITVRDTGEGLPPEDWQAASRRFFDSAGASPSQAGLGLAIVGAVAKAHGGSLKFARPPEGGFAASLVVPAAPAEKSEKA